MSILLTHLLLERSGLLTNDKNLIFEDLIYNVHHVRNRFWIPTVKLSLFTFNNILSCNWKAYIHISLLDHDSECTISPFEHNQSNDYENSHKKDGLLATLPEVKHI